MCAVAVKRKKKPKAIAVVDQDGCTGCEVCIYFCPIEGCIVKMLGPELSDLTGVCEVLPDLCIGCGLCARECPWDAIQMIPVEALAAAGTSVNATERPAEGEAP